MSQQCNQSIFTSIYVFFIAQFFHFGRNVIFTAVHFTDTGREHLIRHPYHSSSADDDLGSWRSREKWVYLKTRDWAFHTGIHWNSDVRIHFFRLIAICTGIVHAFKLLKLKLYTINRLSKIFSKNDIRYILVVFSCLNTTKPIQV